MKGLEGHSYSALRIGIDRMWELAEGKARRLVTQEPIAANIPLLQALTEYDIQPLPEADGFVPFLDTEPYRGFFATARAIALGWDEGAGDVKLCEILMMGDLFHGPEWRADEGHRS